VGFFFFSRQKAYAAKNRLMLLSAANVIHNDSLRKLLTVISAVEKYH
jgi:hypothetical protein